jgi:hypothetical protein
MPRLAFKPDASFFRKIVIGAIGSRAVCTDLGRRGHQMVELERGSTDTKLWKDVKRKRVRIPDLVCTRCGLRVESRAKTKAELAMSHSPTDVERAWDFGMVDTDAVAFPVCVAAKEKLWTAGRLGQDTSYWHERNWVQWQHEGAINYFLVRRFRATPPIRTSIKGVTEGSETAIAWPATFSSRAGTVEAIDGQRVTIVRTADHHRHTWSVVPGQRVVVTAGQQVGVNEIIGSAVPPLTSAELKCPGAMAKGHLERLLSSRERTQRFTGVKLARLLKAKEYGPSVKELADDTEEDVYIRLEGVSYLVAVCAESAPALFGPFLTSTDAQTQLEAVIALGETATPGAIEILAGLLDDPNQSYFLRSAAAWCLARAGGRDATGRLVRAFTDVDRTIREEALEGIVSLGGTALPILLAGLRDANPDIVAGCAEAIRQQRPLPEKTLARLVDELRAPEPSPWVVWLVGHLPREQVTTAIADLQDRAPQLHYAISLLWSFVESWIARRWELRPGAVYPPEENHDV